MASRVAELAIKMTVEDDSQAGFSSVSRSISRLRSSAGSELSGIAQVASRAGAALKNGISDGATFALGAIGAMAQGAQTQIGKIINSVLSLKTALLAIATGALMKGAWDWLIEPNMQLEQMELRVRSYVDDAEKAAEIIAFLREQATKPGMNPQEVFAAGIEWLPTAMQAGENFGEVFTDSFSKAMLISAQTGKPLSEVMTALEEFYGGYATGLARVLNIPPDVVQERMKAFGLMGKSSEELGTEHEALATRERDLVWAIQELNMAMAEGEKVQLGRVTSVTKQAAADLKEQHRLVQLTEQLEAVRKEREENEAAQQRLTEGGSEAGRATEALSGLMEDAGINAQFLTDQEETLRYQIDRVTNKFKELLQIMGLPVTEEGLFETFKRFGDWIDEHWVQLSSFATLIGEQIAKGIETMATWIAGIDWEGVGSSLKSWGEGFAGVATFLGEVLKIINKWPPWAKSLLIGGLALQAATGLPVGVAGLGAAGTAAAAKGAMAGWSGKGVAAAGAGAAGVGAAPIVAGTAVGAAAAAMYAYSLSKMKPGEYIREKGYTAGAHTAAMDIVERRRRGVPEAFMMGSAPVNVTVEPGSFKFDFHGTVSPAERQAIMDDMAGAIDEGFVQPLTRRLEDGFRR